MESWWCFSPLGFRRRSWCSWLGFREHQCNTQLLVLVVVVLWWQTITPIWEISWLTVLKSKMKRFIVIRGGRRLAAMKANLAARWKRLGEKYEGEVKKEHGGRRSIMFKLTSLRWWWWAHPTVLMFDSECELDDNIRCFVSAGKLANNQAWAGTVRVPSRYAVTTRFVIQMLMSTLWHIFSEGLAHSMLPSKLYIGCPLL